MCYVLCGRETSLEAGVLADPAADAAVIQTHIPAAGMVVP